MKYQITAEDEKVMKRDLASNRTLKHLKNMSFYKFSVGDILIREDRYSGEWKVRKAECGLPYKYVYVFENELGVGYMRRLSINGRKFVEQPICVVEFDPSETRFALDPEYADHMLLAEENEEFNAKVRYDEIKKKREQINRKNKKNKVSLTSTLDVIEWMKKLSPGDQFWSGYGIGSINKNPHFVQKVEINHKIPERSLVHVAGSPNFQGFHYKFSVEQIMRYTIFMTRPIFFDEIVN